MTTIVRDIIVGSLTKLGVVDATAEATAEDVDDGLTAFNDMVTSWPMQGLHHGVGDMELSQPLPFDDAHRKGLKALLAVELAPLWEIPVPDWLAREAREAWMALQSDFSVVQPLRADCGLLNMPSQRRG